MFPYTDKLGFGFGADEATHPENADVGQLDALRRKERMLKENKAVDKTAEGKPGKVTKQVQESPVNISLNFNTDSVADIMRMKGMVKEMDSDPADMLRRAVNSDRVPHKRYDSIEALSSSLQELSPMEMKLVEKHLRQAFAEIKGKNHKENY